MYKTIKITFRNGNAVLFGENDWDDYAVFDKFIVVKKDNAWVAIYAVDEVFSVEVFKQSSEDVAKFSC